MVMVIGALHVRKGWRRVSMRHDAARTPSSALFTNDPAFDKLIRAPCAAHSIFQALLFRESSMPRRLLFAFLSAMFFYGLAVALAPPVQAAASCDVNACISACSKKCPTPGCACAQNCMQAIEKRKKAGQCKSG
jgi:hypothetical protein